VTASATAEKPTLMLLDGNSLAFRAFYALPAENFKTQGGLTTKRRVRLQPRCLINLLRDEQPRPTIAAAFDVSRQDIPTGESTRSTKAGPVRDA